MAVVGEAANIGRHRQRGDRGDVQNLRNVDHLARMLGPALFRHISHSPPNDFQESRLDTTYWTTSKDVNAVGWAPSIPQNVNGTLTGVAGTSDGEGIGIAGPRGYKASQDCGAEIRMRSNSVTGIQIDFGFIDYYCTDIKDPVVTGIDVPAISNGCSDAAVLSLMTSQVANKFNLVAKSSLIPGTTQASSTGFAPTADTDFVLSVQCIGVRPNGTSLTNATVVAQVFDQNFVLQGEVSVITAINSTTFLQPYLNVTRLSTSNKVPFLDYFVFWQNRY